MLRAHPPVVVRSWHARVDMSRYILYLSIVPRGQRIRSRHCLAPFPHCSAIVTKQPVLLLEPPLFGLELDLIGKNKKLDFSKTNFGIQLVLKGYLLDDGPKG